MTTPFVVVEAGPLALADARGELASRGWAEVTEMTVEDEPGAEAAVLQAMADRALLIDARAPRPVLDRMCEDLRKLGWLDHRVHLRGDELSEDQHALLNLLRSGHDLGDTLDHLHLSRRSVDRRLAAARTTLKATTTLATVAAYQRRLDRLPRPPRPGQAPTRR